MKKSSSLLPVRTRENCKKHDEIASGSKSSLSFDESTIQNTINVLSTIFFTRLKEMKKIEDTFLEQALEREKIWLAWKRSSEQCTTLKNLVEDKSEDICELEKCLSRATQMLNEEKKKKKCCEQEIHDYKSAISRIMKNVYLEDHNNPANHTKKNLGSLYPNRRSLDESTIQNKLVSSTSSTDSSYLRFEEELDSSRYLMSGKTWKTLQCTSEMVEPPAKKARFTSPQVDNHNKDLNYKNSKYLCTNTRNIQNTASQHCFTQKIIVIQETCFACVRKIKFGKSALKCTSCKGIYHTDCRKIIPTLCLNSREFEIRNKSGCISYFAPLETPMVPHLILTCIKEVERRGLQVEGIYKLPGCYEEVQNLTTTLLSSVEPQKIETVDIHVVTNCLKEFFLSLSEPLLTPSLLNELMECMNKDEQTDILSIYQILSDLPQPNRDTLVCIIIHLQKVVNCPECKMSVENLAEIFDPLFFGNFTFNASNGKRFGKVKFQTTIMPHLINIPESFWKKFIVDKKITNSNEVLYY